MATRLSWWLGGTALVCLLIALGYLPPRGLGSIGRNMSLFSWWREPKVSEARLKAQKLEAQWREVNGQLQASRFRQEAEPELQARRARGEQGPLLVFAPDSQLEKKRAVVKVALDSAWRQLDLHDAKVDILVAIPSSNTGNGADTPGLYLYGTRTYLLPDSTDRTTCIAVLPLYWSGRENAGSRFQMSQVMSWVRNSLGPCAFYARFGAPGPRVRRWLNANRFDVAETSDWSGIRRIGDEDEFEPRFGSAWWYMELYSIPYNTLACLSGRISACTRALQQGDQETGTPLHRVVSPSYSWRLSQGRLINQDRFLASVFRKSGETDFQEFWTTTLPVDSALTLALHEPAAGWSQRWQLEGARAPRLGAAAPLSAMLLATLVAVLVLGGAAYATRWRQVR
jgi:hypothetical protein